jgi:DNA-binding NtrC family response regulator
MKPASPVVLLIDGQDDVRNALAVYLRECGYGVIEAKDSKQAKAALKASQPKVHAALIDAATVRSGYALRNWIMCRHPSVEVILAGSTDNTIRGAGEVCKDGPAIEKPYDHSRVLDRIRRSLGRDQIGPNPK